MTDRKPFVAYGFCGVKISPVRCRCSRQYSHRCKTKCSASQSTLDSNTCNKAMGILKHKYRTLKELLVSHWKLKVVKEIRQDQLVVMKDSHNNDIILGQGKFDVFMLISLSLSGESVNVAVILNWHQKKLLLMRPIFCRAFITRHSPLFFGVCFLEGCITCSC